MTQTRTGARTPATSFLEDLADSLATVMAGRLPTLWVAVFDTSALLDLVVDVARASGRSMTVPAARSGVLRLIVTESQVAEVNRNLDRRARDGHVSPSEARAVWEQQFVPLMTAVSVSVPSDGRYEPVRMRGLDDARIAWLADVVGAEFLWTKDKDLLSTGFGAPYSGRTGNLIGTVATADGFFAGSIVGVGSVAFGFGQAGVYAFDQTRQADARVRALVIGCLLGAAAALLTWHTRAPEHFRKVVQWSSSAAKDAANLYGQVARERVLAARSLPSRSDLGESTLPRVAHVLARSAVELSPQTISERSEESVEAVHRVLASNQMFQETAGAWRLGRPVAAIERVLGARVIGVEPTPPL